MSHLPLRSSSSPLRRAPIAALLLLALAGCGNESDAHAGHGAAGEGVPAPLPVIPDAARVFFVTPSDGATVVGPLANGKVTVHVEMGVEALTVMPAGTLVEGSGHHHIVIDGDPVPRATAVPADAQHIHYGLGQTEADLQLEPGPHTLQLQFADGAHRSYGSQAATLIHINVAPADREPPPAPAPEAPAAEPAAE